jgi:hypothetical protein
MFVRLIAADGETIYINPRHVVMIKKGVEGLTELWFSNTESLLISGYFDEVASLLRGRD